MNSRYAGTCPICRNQWAEGDPIWYEKGTAAICMDCHDAGNANPPKATNGTNGTNGGSQARAAAPPDRGEAVALLREIRDLLIEVRTELQAIQTFRPASPQEPEPV